MKKIKSPDDLRKLREEILSRSHTKDSSSSRKVRIRVHSGTSGLASGAKAILEFISTELEKRNIEAEVIRTGDLGYSFAEPTIEVTRPGEDPVVFGNVDKLKADEIIEKYIKNGDYVDGILPINYRAI
ncbi:MAG: (2Fe-2S) ferredoxin domain-containing protein [Bacteroidota bacterium]|nr:(2Fe-2S) ferredoxin domain-containing protein [Bacteroidota bacterium]